MTVSTLQGVGYACFGFSYLLAFLLELGRLAWPRPGWRPVALAWGVIGLTVLTFYILLNQPPPAAPAGWHGIIASSRPGLRHPVYGQIVRGSV